MPKNRDTYNGFRAYAVATANLQLPPSADIFAARLPRGNWAGFVTFAPDWSPVWQPFKKLGLFVKVEPDPSGLNLTAIFKNTIAQQAERAGLKIADSSDKGYLPLYLINTVLNLLIIAGILLAVLG